MSLSPNDFQVLEALDAKEITSQRQLAADTGISLGQINYVLHRLLEKGLVKIGNFKKNPKKIGYAYLLTPGGIEAKSRMAVGFVMRKLDEYNRMKSRLADRLLAISHAGNRRIVFVGPGEVRDFVASIIAEQALDLDVVGHAHHPADLADATFGPFDVALLFHESAADMEKAAAASGLPEKRLVPLW